ncbi:protein arginine methyltransferase NDUFAF7, mitochondrial-like [Limulus polyphemus]|uniref:Protein arginine methyltransferase NDUFAF7 n=1 Tax=Limulus polyphemus TaxID=6850 RepID=A0ABM1BGK1_LIMPO|nr:protein arginine methyltransferase NDUFAF7, mitochondrial-like [Limulus polyphemus]XP_022249539.1 protein arginine methyltransferase NDUFAF7, mitochondrial-like [Limulus polyphemus]
MTTNLLTKMSSAISHTLKLSKSRGLWASCTSAWFSIGSGPQSRRKYSVHAHEKSRETKLLHHLRARISATGPVTVAEYMKEVLTNPMSGYYMHRDVIGSSGDFITSPEISQMFGELIAIWFLNEWTKVGKPKPLYVVELGPGRGTLSDDMLRVFSQFSDSREVVSLHLVEVSPHLSQLQELKLCGTVSVVKDVLEAEDRQRHLHLHTGPESEEHFYKYNITKHGVPVSWYRHLEDVPRGFSCFIAHEFFDALPIHKFQKTPEGWREVLIDTDDTKGPHHLRYVLSRGPTPASKFFIDPKETRNNVEVSPESGVLVQDIAIRLEEEGGCGLVVDYGHDGNKGDTFRAFRRHALHDPLCEPGTADLTADVDFSYLKKLVQGRALTYGPIPQGTFLENMSIKARLEKLLKSATPELEKELKSGYDMLVSPEKMGDRFKFLALYPTDMQELLAKQPPAGFLPSK